VEEAQSSYRRHFPFVATLLCLYGSMCVRVAVLRFLSIPPQRFEISNVSVETIQFE
jgi:hypothetical protein